MKYLLMCLISANTFAFVPAIEAVKIYNKIITVNNIKNAPTLIISVDDEINGYYSKKDKAVILNTGLLQELDENGIAMTIGHELTHAKYKHVNYLLQSSKSSQAQEYLADKEGKILVEKAGYDMCEGMKWMPKQGDWDHPDLKHRKRALKCK